MIPSLNYTLLSDAIYAIKEGNIRHCETLGFTFEEMNILNQLSLDELFIVSRAAVPIFTVSVHHDVLQHLLIQASQEYQRLQQIKQAIRLGGSIALLNHYYGLTSNEICLLRRMLGIKVPFGRTPEPDEETDAEIWLQWQKYRIGNLESPEALASMMKVTEIILPKVKVLSLTTVWKRIALCEQQTANRGRLHAG